MKTRNFDKKESVSILLCTYNGEKYLEEQLKSIILQTYSNWKIYASDDGSQDNTISILNYYKNKIGNEKIEIMNGPKKGYALNFITLLNKNIINSDFYAFCDQDDYWLKDKIEQALIKIKKNDQCEPILYCGRSQYVDENLLKIGMSPKFKKKPDFKNALVQNIAGGNTMIFNNAARLCIKEFKVSSIVSHDWLAYQIISGTGGKVIYDDQFYILYRQHNNSLIGHNSSFISFIKRAIKIFNGKTKKINDLNVENLIHNIKLLTIESKDTLFNVIKFKNEKNILIKIKYFYKSKIYKQTFKSNILMLASIILNKF
jgi:glycosyltransferase involved in cell wall biosynthesis